MARDDFEPNYILGTSGHTLKFYARQGLEFGRLFWPVRFKVSKILTTEEAEDINHVQPFSSLWMFSNSSRVHFDSF